MLGLFDMAHYVQPFRTWHSSFRRILQYLLAYFHFILADIIVESSSNSFCTKRFNSMLLVFVETVLNSFHAQLLQQLSYYCTQLLIITFLLQLSSTCCSIILHVIQALLQSTLLLGLSHLMFVVFLVFLHPTFRHHSPTIC